MIDVSLTAKRLAANWPLAPVGGLNLCLHEICEVSGASNCSRELALAFVGRAAESGRRVVAIQEGERLRKAQPTCPFLTVTFDDAYASARSLMEELLNQGVPISLAAIAHPQQADGLDWRRLLTIQELMDLADNGATLLPHGSRHRRLDTLSAEEVDDELRDSRDFVAELAGEVPSGFVLPFGVTSSLVRSRLSASSYQWAYGLRQGCAMSSSDYFDLPRFCLSNDTPGAVVDFVLSGWYDRWHALLERSWVAR
jgi:peptidoglycan/xylan/chitin deacetylase (PgdA/CDA1 family)